MLPSAFARTHAASRQGGGLPRPLLLAAFVVGILVVVFGVVVATMGVAPTSQQQVLELSVQ